MQAEPLKPYRLTDDDRAFLRSLRIAADDGLCKGTRVRDGHHARLVYGAYGRDANGVWEVCTPNGRRGSLEDHQVTEHGDGTITVSPSIRVDAVRGNGGAMRPGWEGYLVRGVWREKS